jgi:hypothetical protein
MITAMDDIATFAGVACLRVHPDELINLFIVARLIVVAERE